MFPLPLAPHLLLTALALYVRSCSVFGTTAKDGLASGAVGKQPALLQAVSISPFRPGLAAEPWHRRSMHFSDADTPCLAQPQRLNSTQGDCFPGLAVLVRSGLPINTLAAPKCSAPPVFAVVQLQLDQLAPYSHGHGCRAMLTAFQLLLALVPTVVHACRDTRHHPVPAQAPAAPRPGTSWLASAAAEAEANADHLFALLAGATGPLVLQAAAWCATASFIWLIAVALESGTG